MPTYRLRARKGFSLIELVGITILIGILASMAFQAFSNATTRSNNAAVQSNIHQIQQGVLAYQSDNERLPLRFYSTNPAALDPDAMLCPVADRRYIPGNRLPKTPWSHNAQKNNLTPHQHNPAAGMWRITNAATASSRLVIPGTPAVLDQTGQPPSRATVQKDWVDYAATTFGAVLYETNTARNQYLLYGIGKHGADPNGAAAGTGTRVVALETNLN